MIDPSVSTKVSRYFRVLLLSSIFCLACLTMTTAGTLSRLADGNKSHAESFEPAQQISNSFEREILNARIFFVYFVTIQKPGSLDGGWERYHNASARLRDMTALVAAHPELANLRELTARLDQDVADYGVALAATLAMVQGGEHSGAHYDAQVKEWAERGAVMVKDAGDLETLTSSSSEAHTAAIARSLHEGETIEVILFSMSGLICMLMTMMAKRKLKAIFEAETPGGKPTGPRMLDAVQTSPTTAQSGAH